MNHQFSDLEGLRIAVEMERRGVEFYRRAARLTKSEGIVRMLEDLAAEEESHRRDFARNLEAQCQAAPRRPPRLLGERAPTFRRSRRTSFFLRPDEVKEGGIDSLSAILTTAIDSEKNSILFYTELRD